MIASIAGEVAVRRSGHVVVETAGGVGYRLSVSAETLRQVPAAGGSVSLLTYLSVREDALSLYGFATEEELALFELLVGVQGVGPKVALGVLGAGTPRELIVAIGAGDVRRLQSTPGIGKRIAERIVAELRVEGGHRARRRTSRSSSAAPTSRTSSPGPDCLSLATTPARPTRCCAPPPARRQRSCSPVRSRRRAR